MSTVKQQAAAARRTKKYKTLTTVLSLDDPAALKVLGIELPVEAEPDPHAEALAGLVAGGFTLEEAEAILAASGEDVATPAAAPKAKTEPKAPVTSKDKAEALVEDSGLTYTKGRVYLNADAAEAIVRVRKTGTPEILTSSTPGRTKAVLFYREESGDVAAQNLTAKPDDES